jgi:phosphoribosyl 1,2-cyclic phosphate phosphodiesterase
MIIRLLGTGAADGIPGLYSDSRVSHFARANGGKEIRSRASAIVDLGLKIDLPPDTFYQLTRDGLDARDWTGLVFTHSHEDHFAVGELQYGMHPFNEREYLGYVIYGNAAICDGVEKHYPNWPIETVLTKSFEPFVHMDYVVTPFEANHKEDEDSQNLLIQREDRTLIYATDTGIWPEETWDFLSGVQADALVIECTDGFVTGGYEGHLDVARLRQVVERLRAQKTLVSGSQVITTHHSHQGDATHEELVATLVPEGIKVGYDGMIVHV